MPLPNRRTDIAEHLSGKDRGKKRTYHLAYAFGFFWLLSIQQIRTICFRTRFPSAFTPFARQPSYALRRNLQEKEETDGERDSEEKERAPPSTQSHEFISFIPTFIIINRIFTFDLFVRIVYFVYCIMFYGVPR